MIKRLAHVNIGSHDLAASERFYCDILGLKKAFEFERGGEVIGFYVAVGETTFIEIFRHDDPTDCTRPIIPHLCLEVEDIDAVIADVRAKDWEITDKKWGADNAWQAWITDPGGVSIELMEYTPESTQFTGETCVLGE